MAAGDKGELAYTRSQCDAARYPPSLARLQTSPAPDHTCVRRLGSYLAHRGEAQLAPDRCSSRCGAGRERQQRRKPRAEQLLGSTGGRSIRIQRNGGSAVACAPVRAREVLGPHVDKAGRHREQSYNNHIRMSHVSKIGKCLSKTGMELRNGHVSLYSEAATLNIKPVSLNAKPVSLTAKPVALNAKPVQP